MAATTDREVIPEDLPDADEARRICGTAVPLVAAAVAGVGLPLTALAVVAVTRISGQPGTVLPAKVLPGRPQDPALGLRR